jgi:uncharacterized protein
VPKPVDLHESLEMSPAPTAPLTSAAEPLTAFAPCDIAGLIVGFRDALRMNQDPVNRLNVYPVPDGDTGTNMRLTMESVVTYVDDAIAAAGLAHVNEAPMELVCQAISRGALMGGRGNSGVILSQILSGLTSGFRSLPRVGAHDFAVALSSASAAAYGAVSKPIEGTILTVVRSAAEGASDSAGVGGSLFDVLLAARAQAGRALAQTPELLPVLKAAGVVDAGGAGFCLLLDAALSLIDGRSIPLVEAPGTPLPEMSSAHSNGSSELRTGHGGVPGIEDLRYEVMYFLEAPDHSIPSFKDAWSAIGDSIVVAGGDGLWNCHIHTDDVGAAIEAALDIGRPRKIRVTDLLEEVEEEKWVREASAAGQLMDEPPHANEPCTTAIVAVTSGEGTRRLFLSLGVQRIVTGGQSMNPSTAELLEAVESAPANNVILLPNNKNIIPVAEQIAPLTSKTVRVIATRGVTEGLAAAMQYDPEGDADANAEAMRSAAASVVSGEITQAVRDSSADAGPIKSGDHLGITREGGIVVVAPALLDACTQLLDRLITANHEIVTIIEGEGASTGVTRHIVEWIDEHKRGVVAEVHNGGQPMYPYYFGIE